MGFWILVRWMFKGVGALPFLLLLFCASSKGYCVPLYEEMGGSVLPSFTNLSKTSSKEERGEGLSGAGKSTGEEGREASMLRKVRSSSSFLCLFLLGLNPPATSNLSTSSRPYSWWEREDSWGKRVEGVWTWDKGREEEEGYKGCCCWEDEEA
jgi:hypothetical protein